MSEQFEYRKISQLPEVNNIAATDVFVMNANGKTSKVTLATLIAYIKTAVDVTAIAEQIETMNTNITKLGEDIATNSATIDNIIAAGFNIIGIDE